MFWFDWAALAEAAENRAEAEQRHNAKTDRQYEQIKRDK
jgi:hypothetical protein